MTTCRFDRAAARLKSAYVGNQKIAEIPTNTAVWIGRDERRKIVSATGPTVLAETWQVRQRPTLFFAGQMSGVEGYVESAASGLMACPPP